MTIHADKWPKPKRHKMYDSLNSMALEMGWPQSSLQKWAAAGRLKKTKSGRWSSRAVWKVVEEELQKIEDNQPGASGWLDEQRKWKSLQEKLRYQQLAGELFHASSVREAFLELCERSKTRAVQMPSRLAIELAQREAPDIRVRLERELSALFDEMERIAAEIQIQGVPDGDGAED